MHLRLHRIATGSLAVSIALGAAGAAAAAAPAGALTGDRVDAAWERYLSKTFAIDHSP